MVMAKVIERKRPGKPRAKNSTLSYSGWGLTPEEDKQVIAALEEKDISAKQLVRALVKQWLDQGCPGAIVFGGVHTSLKRIGK
jgi:hypothetical protein